MPRTQKKLGNDEYNPCEETNPKQEVPRQKSQPKALSFLRRMVVVDRWVGSAWWAT
jgi:hypothetical protein